MKRYPHFVGVLYRHLRRLGFTRFEAARHALVHARWR